MKIYGIYDKRNQEQCLRIGTLQEIVKFLDITARELNRALIKNSLIKNQYELCFLFYE